jgi:TrmH family RNA methyltransferase
MDFLTVVLVGISNPGNLGAIARGMANFNVSKLVLVNPKCSPQDIDALVRSKQGHELLKKAKIVNSLENVNADYLIATTAKLGTDYNIPRSPLSPEQLAKKISKVKAKFALVFGRESDGLTNDEILKCDFSVTIPSNPKYPTLNLSHAVLIMLYEIFKQSREKKTGEHIVYASKKEKSVLLKIISKVLDNMKFATAEKKQTQKTVWKRLVGKAELTKREAFAVIGFFKKLL